MAEDKDLWSLWSHQRVGETKHEDGKASDDARAALVAKAQELDMSREEIRRRDTPEVKEIPAEKRSAPLLTGKLAEYLKHQPRRENISKLSFHETSETWSTNDTPVRAAAAMALVLANHVARFGGTAFAERTLEEARDSLLHTFSPKDAVNIEVEAYELIQWFAGAINPEWREQSEESSEQGVEAQMMDVLTLAITKKRDLVMRYYTGSRSEFSERRITPLQVTAEKYLVAFCHLRKEERVFRVSRIVQLSPAEHDENDDLFMYPIRTSKKIDSSTKQQVTKEIKETDNSIDKNNNVDTDNSKKNHRKRKNKQDDEKKKVSDAHKDKTKKNDLLDYMNKNQDNPIDYMNKNQDNPSKNDSTKKKKNTKDKGPMLPGLN